MNKGEIITCLFFFAMLIEAAVIAHPSMYLFHVEGRSMMPTSPPHNFAICVTPSNSDSYGEGDIVATSYAHHRIVKTNSTHVWTQGDNDKDIDEPVKRADVVCRTELLIPTGKAFIKLGLQ